MKQKLLQKTLLLLFALIAGSTSVWAADVTTTLTGSSIVKSGTPGTSYADYDASANIKDDHNYVYTGRWCYQKVGTTYLNMVQIKKTESSNSSRIVLPQFGGDIKSITITATNTSATSSDGTGATTRLKVISGTTYTTTYANASANIVATAGSSSAATKTYEFDFTGLANKYDGKDLYICSADAGIRIWSIVVVYEEKTASSVAFTETTPSIGYPATNSYTQAATVAAGYDGTIAYALSENTCGATIEGATVSVTQEGSVKVTATAPATANYAFSEASYVLTVTDSRVGNDLAYAVATQTIEVGAELAAPTLTNPHGLDVTYESDDTGIATVDASGNVTGVAIGSTTISAIFAGNATYKAGTVSYTINVTRAKFVGELFYESVSGYTESSDGSSMNTSSEYLDSEDWASFTQAYPGKTGGFKLGSSSNTASLVTKSIALTGNGKLTYQVQRYDNSNNGNLTVSVTGATAVGDVNVTGTADWVEKTVYLIGGTGNVVITFATTSSNKRIRLDEILLVEGGATVPVTITTADYATFCSAVDLDFSETGITVYQAKVESNKVKFTEVTDGLVPAYTGVLLYKDVDAETVVNVPVTTGVAALSENELVGVTTEEAIEYNPDTDVYNYILQMNGANLVFRKATGAKLRANRAYLSTSYDVTAPGARELEVSFGDETAINALENSNKVNDGAIYDLSGRRVENPTKGIYIMNGKKVVIK